MLIGEAAQERAVSGWSWVGSPMEVLRPHCTEAVSAVLRLCNEACQPVTPWGGKTGLVHGIFSDGTLALSLERMDRIEEVDPLGKTLAAEAGCILQTATEAAEAHDLLLPLDLGARGSVSAEHGIGFEKRDYLPRSRSQNEVALMRLLKSTLDPNNILNPGKVL
ncbi:MAG: FAD-binding protein [Alphaproteobacteria bacterium]|nr:FAD-binding protein [Alphaproteobacteria bacterium]